MIANAPRGTAPRRAIAASAWLARYSSPFGCCVNIAGQPFTAPASLIINRIYHTQHEALADVRTPMIKCTKLSTHIRGENRANASLRHEPTTGTPAATKPRAGPSPTMCVSIGVVVGPARQHARMLTRPTLTVRIDGDLPGGASQWERAACPRAGRRICQDCEVVRPALPLSAHYAGAKRSA